MSLLHHTCRRLHHTRCCCLCCTVATPAAFWMGGSCCPVLKGSMPGTTNAWCTGAPSTHLTFLYVHAAPLVRTFTHRSKQHPHRRSQDDMQMCLCPQRLLVLLRTTWATQPLVDCTRRFAPPKAAPAPLVVLAPRTSLPHVACFTITPPFGALVLLDIQQHQSNASTSSLFTNPTLALAL